MVASVRGWGVAEDLRGLPDLEAGDHVCWIVDDGQDFDAEAARCLAEGRRAGDRLIMFGPRHGLRNGAARAADVMATDPRRAFLRGGRFDADVLLETFRTETTRAHDEGFTGLRLVADMDWLLEDPPSAPDLERFELCLDEVVAETGATIVCAYRTRSFGEAHLARVAAVHPLTAGAPDRDPRFRVFARGDGGWRVTGEIDLDNAGAFEQCLAGIGVRPGPDGRTALRLDFSELGFIDAAGMRAIAGATRGGSRRVRLEAPRPVFRQAWAVAVAGRPALAVELAP